MSWSRLFLLISAVATGTLLVLMLASDAIAGINDPSVWVNTLLIATAVLVLVFVSLGNRERLERDIELQQSEHDLTELRNVRSFR